MALITCQAVGIDGETSAVVKQREPGRCRAVGAAGGGRRDAAGPGGLCQGFTVSSRFSPT